MTGPLHTAHAIGTVARQAPERLIVSASGLVLGAVWDHAALEVAVTGLPQHAVALHLSGCTLVEKWRDGRLRGHQARLQSVSLVPAHASTSWVLRGPSRVAHLYVDPAALGAANASADQPLDCVELDDFFAVPDAVLAALVRLMLAQPQGAGADPLAHDQLMSMVLRHLLGHYGVARRAPQDQANSKVALTAITMQRLFSHIEARLAGPAPLRLRELAGIAHLSDDHFLRAFRATVGQTPYQYLLCRRIDLARQMLHRSKLPIAGVGRAVGFGSASHFAAMFRQHVGVTPGEWRHARSH